MLLLLLLPPSLQVAPNLRCELDRGMAETMVALLDKRKRTRTDSDGLGLPFFGFDCAFCGPCSVLCWCWNLVNGQRLKTNSSEETRLDTYPLASHHHQSSSSTRGTLGGGDQTMP